MSRVLANRIKSPIASAIPSKLLTFVLVHSESKSSATRCPWPAFFALYPVRYHKTACCSMIRSGRGRTVGTIVAGGCPQPLYGRRELAFLMDSLLSFVAFLKSILSFSSMTHISLGFVHTSRPLLILKIVAGMLQPPSVTCSL